MNAAHSLLAEIAVATPGATLQIEPGAAIGGTLPNNTLTLGKPLTIVGDPNDPHSSLLSGVTIQYTPGGGSDTLKHLDLGAGTVTGSTSGNLTIQDDLFAVSADAISINDANTSGSLTLSGDSIAVAGAANVNNIILAQTEIGGITVSGQTLTVTGQVEDNAIDLSSIAGPISVTGVNFDATDAIDRNAININTAGNVTLNADTVDMPGQLQGIGVNVQAANCSISNLTVNATEPNGSIVGALAVNANQNLTMTGNNIVSVAGSVGTGVSLTAAAGTAAVSNLAATFGSEAANTGTEVANDAIDIVARSQAVATNINLTVVGDCAGDGLSVTSNNNSVSLGASTLQFTGEVENALAATAATAVLVNGPIKEKLGSSTTGIDISANNGGITIIDPVFVTATGDVSGAICDFDAPAGPVAINAGLTLTGLSSVANGLQVRAGGGVTNTAPIAVTANGQVNVSGISVTGSSNLKNVNLTLRNGSAGDGMDLTGNINATGPGSINLSNATVNIEGEVANALNLNTNLGRINVANSVITVADGSNGANGSGSALMVDSTSGNVSIINNHVTTNTADVGGMTGMTVSEGGSLMLENNKVVMTGSSVGIGVSAVELIGNPNQSTVLSVNQTIAGNYFQTYGDGMGLNFANSGSTQIFAKVENNDFQNNQIGVAITGGTEDFVDLGGGAMGSPGGNFFKGYTGANGFFAVALPNSSNSSIVFAKNDVFGTSDPTAVVQDSVSNNGGGLVVF